MAADNGKKRGQGGDPQALIDAEAFWDDQAGQAEEEEVTAPHQPRPQVPPPAPQSPPPAPKTPPPAPRRPASAQPVDEDDDPDLAVVGPGGMFPGQSGQGAGRTRPPQRPPARPAQARPASAGLPQARANTPAVTRPPSGARQRPTIPPPAPPSMPEPESEVAVEDTTANPMRIALALVAVVAVSAFLGWFLIGRHAGEAEKPDVEDPLVDPVEAVAPSVPQQAPEPEQEASAEPAQATQDPSVSVTLKVSSEPPGAQVFVDGEHRGVTPSTVRGLPTSGEASLKIALEGHKPWEQKIALDAEDLNREVNAGLVKISACKAGAGFLYVTSRPPGATIELDGKRLAGKTPKVINDVCAVVPHRLKLEKAGFRPWRQEVRIKPDDIHNLEAKLEH